MNAKRFVVALLLAAIFAAIVQPVIGTRAQASGQYPSEYVFLTTTVNLNLRAGPGTNYTVLGVLPKGSRVLGLGRNATADWALVEWNGVRGWIAVWLTTVEGNVLTLPIETSDTGNSGGAGHCQLDKIGTFAWKEGEDPWLISVGGTEWQHLSIWTYGVQEVSFLIAPSVPAERSGVVNARGFGSLWQDTERRCPDMISDARTMIADRINNHTGLIYTVDLELMTAKVVYNPKGWQPFELQLLLEVFFGNQLRLVH